ncbi:hypothetical protein BCR44DRAFT_1503412 [Catenaria anguillulae PL171]|uniref:Alcohol dehydrogenase-like N-terminal domain-containing protein n=1 Tax=Catenaria anguillulae PL171 TaxID=765915 RepID=A0A1Y2H8G9_9FUNG|nr:hypothetical protein BCR44DRAFT_1503412 [Catenaria anguillulae PL171]
MTATSTTINATDISVQIDPSTSSSLTSSYLLLGTVSAVGTLVTDLAPADRIVIHVPTATGRTCGNCRWCLKGSDDLCSTRANANAPDLIPGQAAVVPAKSAFKVSGYNNMLAASTVEAAASVYAPLRKHMALGVRVGIATVVDSDTVGAQRQLASSFAQVLGAGEVATDSIQAGSVDLLLVLLGEASVPANVVWEELIGKVSVGGKVVIVGAQGTDGQGQGLGIKLNLGAVISGQREVVGSTWEVARGLVEEMVRFADKMSVELAL